MRLNSLVLRTLCALLMMALFGCGGGSSGTDGGVSIRLSGTVKNESGAPLNGIEVMLIETGDIGLTNDEGNYSLTTTVDADSFTIVVSDGSNQSTAVVDNLALVEGDSVGIDLILSQSEFTVSVESVEVNEPTAAEPTPTPKPESTQIVQNVVVKGSLKLPDGRPVRGFKISVVGDRSSDVSDRNGDFSLTTTKRSITLEIENTRDIARVKLPAISSSTRTISVELAIIVALPGNNDIGTLALLPFEAALAKKPKIGR